jgi:hypothetical protein
MTNEQPGFHERLMRPAVELGEASIDVADLVLLGLILGSWAELEQRLERGLALEAMDLPPIPAQEIRSAATYFRYGHNLVSAADFKGWLGERSLVVADLSGVIRRRLLRERESQLHTDGSAPEIGGTMWAEAVCSGGLRKLALAAADRLAAAHRLGAEAPGPGPEGREQPILELAMERASIGLLTIGEAELRSRIRRLLALCDALEQLQTQVADEQAIERCLASHLLDWLQIGGEEFALDTEGAALEARMLIVEDGMPLVEVAERAGVAAAHRHLVLDGVTAEANSALVATAPGEVAGPWLEAEQWRVVLVTAKEPPSPQEPVMRERAIQELMRDALDRTLAGRVIWPQAL